MLPGGLSTRQVNRFTELSLRVAVARTRDAQVSQRLHRIRDLKVSSCFSKGIDISLPHISLPSTLRLPNQRWCGSPRNEFVRFATSVSRIRESQILSSIALRSK